MSTSNFITRNMFTLHELFSCADTVLFRFYCEKIIVIINLVEVRMFQILSTFHGPCPVLFTIHPCLTDPSKVLILVGVSSQVLGGELETQTCLG